MTKFSPSKILTFLMIIVLVINCSLLIWYLFVGYQTNFHSDSAVKVLLAREVYDTRDPFPDDWNYVNDDLFIFFGHLIIIPLLKLMPAGYSTHAIAGLFFSALILHSIWLLTTIGSTPTWQRIGIVAIFASGISAIMAENLYGQVSYGGVILFYCYLIFAAWKYVNTECKKVTRWVVVAGTILLLAYWANPKRAIITYTLPLAVSTLYVLFLVPAREKRKLLLFLFITLVGAIIGIMLHYQTIAGVTTVTGAANAHVISFESFFDQIRLVIKGIYSQLGGLPSANEPIHSIQGAYSILRFATATLAIIIIPIALTKAVSTGSMGIRFLAVFAASAFASIFLLLSVTSIPDMSDPIQSSRYLVPATTLCIIALLMTPIEFRKTPATALLISFIFFMFASSGLPALKLGDLHSGEMLAQPQQINPERQLLLSKLQEKELKYGYATYWNSGSLSVLSNERILIRQVVFKDGLPEPMKHLSSNRWYNPKAWSGRTFLLIHESEFSQINQDRMLELGAKLEEIIRAHGFVIMIYSDNIAQYMPGWDPRYEKKMFFPVHTNTPTQIGHLVKDSASSKLKLEAEIASVGALHFGPYVVVEPGQYRVTFDVYANTGAAPIMRLDVADSPDQKIYAQKTLRGSDSPQTLEFTLSEKKSMEFRVWSLGLEKVTFGGLTLERIGEASEID